MTSVEWKGKSRLQKVCDIPLKVLNISARRMLANYLDVPKTSLGYGGIQQDWKGLAELVGLNIYEIENLNDGKTYKLIESWSHQHGSSIGMLLEHLEQMERYDVLEDEILQNRILKDVQTYQEQQERLKESAGLIQKPIQVPEIDSNHPTCDTNFHTEYRNITTGEVETGVPEFFDAFVCYAWGDEAFVKQLIHMLEGEHGLKLCIKDRDVAAGSAQDTILSYLIAERCRKMIIILSSNFVGCPDCDFMVKFAHSLSPGATMKKLIPIIIQRPCHVPDIIRFITPVDFTNCSVAEWFWNRVIISLKDKCSTGPSTSYEKFRHNMQTKIVTPETKMTANEAASSGEKATETALVMDHDGDDKNSKKHHSDKPRSARKMNFPKLWKDSKKREADIQECNVKFF